MPLTHEDLAKLKAPFAVEDHEFHRELVYLTEEAITNRLDEVDPSWHPLIVDKGYRPTADGSLSFWCHMRITVNGVSRDGIGMSDIVLTKSGKEANEAEKSAATDALKRAARMFGVGRYLLGAKGVKNENDLRRWLNGDQSAQPQTTPRNSPPQQQPKPTTDDLGKAPWTKTQMGTFMTHWRNQGWNDAAILKSLGVSRLSEWTRSQDAADAALVASTETNPLNEYFPRETNGKAS